MVNDDMHAGIQSILKFVKYTGRSLHADFRLAGNIKSHFTCKNNFKLWLKERCLYFGCLSVDRLDSFHKSKGKHPIILSRTQNTVHGVRGA